MYKRQFQITEFARLSGVSKIVVGRSTAKRKHIFAKPTLTEKMLVLSPNLDIYVIPVSYTHLFSNQAEGSTAEIAVYLGGESGKPESGTLVSKQTATVDGNGFYTINLDQPVNLRPGDTCLLYTSRCV